VNPNKLQRVSEPGNRLHYHPESIDKGNVFDAARLEPGVGCSAQVSLIRCSLGKESDICTVIYGPQSTKVVHRGHANRSRWSQPYFQAGPFSCSIPREAKSPERVPKRLLAGWMKKTGSVVFASASVRCGRPTRDIHSTVGGIQGRGSGKV